MSKIKEHIFNKYIDRKAIYKESRTFICVEVIETSITENKYIIRLKNTLPYYFSYENKTFIEGNPKGWEKEFSISGIEEVITCQEDYFYIMYVGATLYFDNDAIAKFENKDKNFTKNLF